MSIPEPLDDLLQAHSGLIHRVVMHCNAPGSVPDLQQALQMAEENGWGELVAVIREIMTGKREDAIVPGLDDETRMVAEAIMRGLQNPRTLPDLKTDIDSPMAARGIAGLLHSARMGNGQSLRIMVGVAKQMHEAGGDMRMIAGRIQALVDGERDIGVLTQGLGEKGRTMMMELVAELSSLERGLDSAGS